MLMFGVRGSILLDVLTRLTHWLIGAMSVLMFVLARKLQEIPKQVSTESNAAMTCSHSVSKSCVSTFSVLFVALERTLG